MFPTTHACANGEAPAGLGILARGRARLGRHSETKAAARPPRVHGTLALCLDVPRQRDVARPSRTSAAKSGQGAFAITLNQASSGD
jgi:hypothetical protein